jgi:surface polysaccharide O-acyltransferase-like enzyme
MSEIKNAKPHNINVDIIKTLAVIGVISIHFFAYIGTYNANVSQGNSIWLKAFCTQLFSFCVPLFLLTTGYLMHKKRPSVSYYKKIGGVLFVYLVTSILFQVFQSLISTQPVAFSTIIRSIINIEGSQYSWYVEMYIGLFVIIPFLNMIWQNLTTKKIKGYLCIALFLLSTAPHLSIADIHLPDYWQFLWPLMYYFIGAYLKEYNFRFIIQKKIILITLSLGWACVATMHAINTNGGIVSTNIVEWNYPWIALYSILLFSTIIDAKITNKLPTLLKRPVTKIASLTLGIYLSSALFDNIIHRFILNSGAPPHNNGIKLFFVTVPLTLLASLFVAWVIDISQKLLLKHKPTPKSMPSIEEI